MSVYSFVEIRKSVAEVATAEGVKISSRHVKSIARQWITQAECMMDRTEEHTLLYSDPTGEAAVKNILSMIHAAREHAQGAA